MKYIVLANTDLRVSQIAYGTTGFDGTFPTESGLALVSKYLGLGGNFLDTAHCYSFWVPGGFGASEKFVGRAVREFGRDRFVIATKGGHIGMPPGYPRPDAFMDPKLVSQDLDESLDRLGLPQVDLYYLHRDDPRIPVDEIISSVNAHVASGRARYVGASNWSVERYAAGNRYAVANGLQPFVILQNQWSLARPNWSDLDSPGAVRYVQDSDLADLERLGIPVAAYTPTGSGFFASNGRLGGFDSDQAKACLAAVNRLSAARGVSPNQIALAYLLNQPFPVIPILGTRDPYHLSDAIGALEVALTAAEMKALSA